jgi:hypothetical protein
VPPPRVHLTRYHGVFAPHCALPAAITLAGRGPGAERSAGRTARSSTLGPSGRVRRDYRDEW